MRVIIQRVTEASVMVNEKIVGKIKQGYVLLVAFTHDDSIDDLNYIVNKVKFIRLFDDDNGIMNLDISSISGSILSVSQFTLYADTNNGRRPNYHLSMQYDAAKVLYDQFNGLMRESGIRVETGIFGSCMQVKLINDGPVTIILDSKEGNL